MHIARIIIGAFIILVSIFQLKEMPIAGILGIALGVSLIPYTWGLLHRKYNLVLDKKYKIIIAVVLLVLFGSTLPESDTPSPVAVVTPTPEMKQEAPQETAKPSEDEKVKAQAELDEVLILATKAGLIKSYEFSETKRVIYADKVWYTQTVTFKKDFMAKVASLRKTITGYHRFEVRDAYSDEKVGEVTAFSGSIEVYK